MFKIGRRKAPKEERIAASMTNTPLSNSMMLLIAQEIPLLDSVSRGRVYEILRNYDGPQITTQEDLPAEIREMMDL